jgi:signal peptidase
VKKTWAIVIDVILGLVIVFSVLIILSSLNIGGRQMFVVKSGSMEPKIKTGSVVFDTKKNDYKVNDVITFKVKDSKDTTTQRLHEVKIDHKKQTFYVTKGDANDAPDGELVLKANVVGKVQFSFPYLGYLVAFIKTLPGLIIFVVIPATIIIYEEISKIKDEIKKIQREKKKSAKKKKTNGFFKNIKLKVTNWIKKNRQEATKRKEAFDEQDN